MSDNFNSVQPNYGYDQGTNGQPMSQPSGIPMPQENPVPQPSAQQWSYQTGPIPQMQVPAPQDTAFTRLFDFSFSKYAAEKAATLFYIMVFVFAGTYLLYGFAFGVNAIKLDAFTAIMQMIFSIVAAIFLIVLGRFFIENCLANIRKAEAVKEILEKLENKE